MAQRTQKLCPSNVPCNSFTAIGDSSTQLFRFYFPGSTSSGGNAGNSYSGYAEVVAWFDSASGTVGDRDSVWVSAYPLMFDVVSNQYERSNDADRDSIDIKNDYNWGTTHSDNRYSFNISINLPPCDAVQINAYTGTNGQCKMRTELRIAGSPW